LINQANTSNTTSISDVSITHNVRLTASEIAQIWTTYMNYSMLTCVFRYFYEIAQEKEIKDLIKESLDRCEKRVIFSRDTIAQDNLSIPIGFTDRDVNIKAPALFSDIYLLFYLRNMIRVSLSLNSLNLSMATRPDIINFYSTCIDSTIKLNYKTTALLLSKGILPRPPLVEVSDKVDYIHKANFLTGFLGEKRPLLTIEIAHLYHNALVNETGRLLLLGFKQVSPNQEVRKYFSQGIQLSDRIVSELTMLAKKENVIFSYTHGADVTDSTEAPFSDKLMMYHVFLLNAIGAGMYGMSASLSGRHDLTKVYSKIVIEVGLFAEKGAKLMIANDWLEEPPQILDREEIAELKH